jgi:hypothetical protein
MRPHALSLLLLASILLFVHAGARSHAVLINTSRPANALDPLAGVDATGLKPSHRSDVALECMRRQICPLGPCHLTSP